MTKILVSPGYGAGWSTWNRGGGYEQTKFVLTYQPIIDFLENGGSFKRSETQIKYKDKDPDYSLLRKMVEDFAEMFGEEDGLYLGGAHNLEVVHVDGPFRVEEYDGNESLITSEDFITL